MDGGAPENFEGGGWWTTTMLWTIILFGSFLLNATLLFAFIKRPGLRTISNRFVMNLVASNLLTCLFLTPLLMLDAPPSSSGSSLCVISEGCSALVVASSIFSVLLIAIDQYFAVVDPLRYRTRIDKLKCGVLIISVWVVSILVAILAAFNPQPQSLWLSCRGDKPVQEYTYERNLSVNLDSTILYGNGTENYNVQGELKVVERNGSSMIEEVVRFTENSTAFSDGTILESSDDAKVIIPETDLLNYVTYGFAYATFYSLFVYLVPFISVCWIYVSIYLAAHKNSERARRTGSGPMLSSPSFCEEYGINVRREFSNEDFRRIPKISSLSSIDESIETSPSHIPRRKSEMMLSSSPIEEEPSTGVVFTVGSQKVDVSPQKPSRIDRSTKDNTTKVPTSLLKAEFLGNRGDSEASILEDNIIRSKFRDRPDNRRKSSHDILCENMLMKDLEQFRNRDDSSDSSSSADEEEMLTFAKNRRLEDIEVAKCQNSIDDHSEFNNIPLIENRSDFSPSANQPNKFIDKNSNEERSETFNSPEIQSHVNGPSSKIIIINNTVQSSNKVTGNGILSRAALEKHNAKSKLQNGRSTINGRYLNGSYINRSDVAMEQPELDVFQKNGSGHHYLEAESSLLGTSAPVVTITPPNKIPLHRVSSIKSTSSYINSLKYRISNGSLFKYREETRAARISALVIVMGLICWTPYVVVLMIRNIPKNLIDDHLQHSYDIMALSFLISAAYITPLLFGYRSRRVKRELRKIFCFKKELSYKNNRSLMAKKVLKRRHSSNLSQIEMESKYNIFSCVYGRNRWPKEKVQFMQVPETALAVETCRSSFSSGASTQISTTSTEE